MDNRMAAICVKGWKMVQLRPLLSKYPELSELSGKTENSLWPILRHSMQFSGTLGRLSKFWAKKP